MQELFEKDEAPQLHPLTNKPAPKSQFVPSKWEAKRVRLSFVILIDSKTIIITVIAT